MNLYLRYFDRETLVYNADQAIDFLCSIPEIGMNPAIEADVREYVASDVYYPKRYKVRPRVYFIIIKTEAATMLDFKQKKALRNGTAPTTERRETVAPVTTSTFCFSAVLTGCPFHFFSSPFTTMSKYLGVSSFSTALWSTSRRGSTAEASSLRQRERTSNSSILVCGNNTLE